MDQAFPRLFLVLGLLVGGCRATEQLKTFYCSDDFSAVSPDSLPHSHGLFRDQTNSNAALEEFFPAPISSVVSAVITQVMLIPKAYDVHFFETNGQCGDARIAALTPEMDDAADAAKNFRETYKSNQNFVQSPEATVDRESLSGVRQGVILIPEGSQWNAGCEMRLVCKQHYTGLPVESWRTNPVWMLHLPISMLLALSAGFLTSNKQLRFTFGGVCGVSTLLAIFVIILIKMTPSQMKTASKILWGIGAVSLMAIKRQIYLFLLPYVWNPGRPFPDCLTPMGWGAVLLVVLAFVVGAYKIEEWTKTPETQKTLKAVFLIFAYTSVAFSLPDLTMGLGIVAILFINEYILTGAMRQVVTWILLLPALCVYYPILALLRAVGAVGAGFGGPEEVFFTGASMSEHSPPAPSPFRRGTRMTLAEAEILSRRNTEIELAKLDRTVANADRNGRVSGLQGWTVGPNGGFSPSPSRREDGHSIGSLSAHAQREFSRRVGQHDGTRLNFDGDDSL